MTRGPAQQMKGADSPRWAGWLGPAAGGPALAAPLAVAGGVAWEACACPEASLASAMGAAACPGAVMRGPGPSSLFRGRLPLYSCLTCCSHRSSRPACSATFPVARAGFAAGASLFNTGLTCIQHAPPFATHAFLLHPVSNQSQISEDILVWLSANMCNRNMHAHGSVTFVLLPPHTTFHALLNQ